MTGLPPHPAIFWALYLAACSPLLMPGLFDAAQKPIVDTLVSAAAILVQVWWIGRAMRFLRDRAAPSSESVRRNAIAVRALMLLLLLLLMFLVSHDLLLKAPASAGWANLLDAAAQVAGLALAGVFLAICWIAARSLSDELPSAGTVSFLVELFLVVVLVVGCPFLYGQMKRAAA